LTRGSNLNLGPIYLAPILRDLWAKTVLHRTDQSFRAG